MHACTDKQVMHEKTREIRRISIVRNNIGMLLRVQQLTINFNSL